VQNVECRLQNDYAVGPHRLCLFGPLVYTRRQTVPDKILREGDDFAIPEFLSDHPEPAARVRDVRAAAERAGCSSEVGDQARWRELQASLGPVAVDSVTGGVSSAKCCLANLNPAIIALWSE
jgi:hypothetical protein